MGPQVLPRESQLGEAGDLRLDPQSQSGPR
jgi:hypothetical protein